MLNHFSKNRWRWAVGLCLLLTVLPGGRAFAEAPAVTQEFEIDWNEASEFDLLADAPGWRLDDIGPAENGSAEMTPDGAVRYVPERDFTGVDRFTFTASAASGDQVEGEVIVWVFATTEFGPEPPGAEALVLEQPPDVPDEAMTAEAAADEATTADAAASAEVKPTGASSLLSGVSPWRHVIRIGLIAGAIFVYFATRKKVPTA